LLLLLEEDELVEDVAGLRMMAPAGMEVQEMALLQHEVASGPQQNWNSLVSAVRLAGQGMRGIPTVVPLAAGEGRSVTSVSRQ
jgi:hypothetical protein